MASLIWLDEKEGSTLYNSRFQINEKDKKLNHDIRTNLWNERRIIAKNNILEGRTGL